MHAVQRTADVAGGIPDGALRADASGELVAAVTMCDVPWDPSEGQYTSTATSGGEHGFH